ncbi:sn-glycerol-3-phosphate ABC transporter ATP-binding protein UgpC [Chamaesiphon sp. VAR_69_metabat_338]|uniref:ABC transporter ATP-binding protein n=1 Tax=Chamaesiphon sp. VAR_69_metabat_338 TaxID=2964704 RepID=UPI00286EB497|nr:sn-glycerol-3-phosphate ABC transporter ATP-binding protein UgpC [Chamaesiphon sp. VAR_69_metabat_338]
MATVKFDRVFKVYANGQSAIQDLCLEIADGEFLVFVGPSGCGKSTALRMLAGLEDISAGKIIIGDRVVNDLTPQQRNIAMVFQNYALYPHMTVRQNLEFPLRMLKLSPKQINALVSDAADKLGLGELLDRKPKQLSGGQRQRVAMGRAIVRDPAVFLMDEPLSNLDAKMRSQIRAEIITLQQRLKTTTVYVTHDQVEAMTMGDRVAVMRGGKLQQVSTPQDLYDRPQNIFVAGFIGSPAMNILRSRLSKDERGNFCVDVGDRSISLGTATIDRYQNLENNLNRQILVGIRPEAFSIAADDANSIIVTVKTIEALGHETIVHANAAIDFIDPDLYGSEASDRDRPNDSLLTARIASSRTPQIVGVASLKENRQLTLKIDTNSLYLFSIDGDLLH